jgi:hypothetical protein
VSVRRIPQPLQHGHRFRTIAHRLGRIGAGRSHAAELLASHATLGSCTFSITDRQQQTYRSMRNAARTGAARYVRTLQWLCSRNRCPTVVGTIITYRDTTHISATYARLLAKPLAVEIARAAV